MDVCARVNILAARNRESGNDYYGAAQQPIR